MKSPRYEHFVHNKPDRVVVNVDGEPIYCEPTGWLASAGDLVDNVNIANGWFESDRTFGDDIALLHSEVSEMLEAYRDHGTEDVTDTQGERLFETTLPKPEGIGSEAADVLVRLLDTCGRYGIDLEYEFHRKLQYNATRGNRHGGKRL